MKLTKIVNNTKTELKNLNFQLNNFCSSLIFLDEYPRCQINIVVHVLSISNDIALISGLFNGVMLALSLSGIDLKTFALTTFFIEKNLIISLDSNRVDNILMIETDIPIKLDDLKASIEKAKEQISSMYRRFQKVMMKKIN